MELQDLLQKRFSNRAYFEDWGDLNNGGRVFYDPPLPSFANWARDVLLFLLTNSTSEPARKVFAALYDHLPQEWWFENVVEAANELAMDPVLATVREYAGKLTFEEDLRAFEQNQCLYLCGPAGWMVVPSAEMLDGDLQKQDDLKFEIRTRTGSRFARRVIDWSRQHLSDEPTVSGRQPFIPVQVRRKAARRAARAQRRSTTQISKNTELANPSVPAEISYSSDQLGPPYDLFICHSSSDYSVAKLVYDELRAVGLKVFLSEECLQKAGISNFAQGIETAMENSDHMLVIASGRDQVLSSWVETEWRMFFNEIASGRKRGNLVTLSLGVEIPELPMMLRSREVIPFDDSALRRLPPYFNGAVPRSTAG